MTRHPEWPERLAAVLADWQDKPFRWGERDCARFALACVRAVSVQNWQALRLPRYRSARGAQHVLTRLQVREVAELVDRLLGPRCAPAFIRRGDLVCLDGGAHSALGVCVGERVAALLPSGLVYLPRGCARSGWRV